MTARVSICLLAIVCAAEAQIRLVVDYPEPANYNLVKLTCTNASSDRFNDAEFLKRAPGQDSAIQLPGSPINGELIITLTQAEEGYFSCSNGSEGGTSSEIGLAGNYSVHVHVYVYN